MLIVALVLVLQLPVWAATPVSSSDTTIEVKVEQLLARMTLEEKVGQMTNIGLTAICKGPFWNDADSLEIDTAKLRYMLQTWHIGSIQGKGKYPPDRQEWHHLIKQIQDYALTETRLGIPVLYGIDGVHGAGYSAGSTLFPQEIACAATWDPAFAYKTGEITSYELKASSTPWNYAPVLDVSCQPLWGRIFETYGEDTYLTTQMGAAYVEGAQQNDLSGKDATAVCLKHFIGYGNPYNGKDRSTAIIPDNELRQYYLPPFQEAIKKGALTVMLNSGSVNGIPGHVNSRWINGVLKGELGFEGFVISDWDDISKLVDVYQVAANVKEATKLAVMAGMDMCMVPYDESFAKNLTELVNEGQVPMARIDDAVRRILSVKYQLGLFEKPYTNPADYPLFGSEQFAMESYLAASESITLLKNNHGILPLQKGTKIMVTGPVAASLNYLNGAWSRSWSGLEEQYNDTGKLSVLEALVQKAGTKNVRYAAGTSIDTMIDLKDAIKQAKKSDVIIACLGEAPATEKPSDINDLDLPPAQIELVKQLSKTGKPIIIVLLEGRPRVFREAEKLSEAVVMAYLPGQEGGTAIADVLFGDVNPSGHLPYTYPRYSGAIWKYNHKASDAMDRNFSLNGFNPQYQFGEGMSYTTFQVSNPEINTDTLSTDDTLQVTVNVKNSGNRSGKTVIQLYLKDEVASLSPDVMRLAGFSKIALEPGESKTVSFTVDNHALAFVDRQNKWVVETGTFQVLVGDSPKRLQSKKFYYQNSK